MKTFRVFTNDNKIKFAGTERPSFFSSLKSAVLAAEFDKGDTVYQVHSTTHVRMWEVLCTNPDLARETEDALPEC